MTMGGLFLLSEQKLVSEVKKTDILHALHTNWGPNPLYPSPLVMLLLLAVRIGILILPQLLLFLSLLI